VWFFASLIVVMRAFHDKEKSFGGRTGENKNIYPDADVLGFA